MGGVLDSLLESVFYYIKDYFDYYKIDCGYYKWLLNLNEGWNMMFVFLLLNIKFLFYSDEIFSVVLIIYGEKVYFWYFVEDVFKKL